MTSPLPVLLLVPWILLAQEKSGAEAHGIYSYDHFEKPSACRPCHVDIFYQWEQAMMSQAYT
ncbi:hypothetical protein ACFL4U_04325, partial [Candidatus Neomarinimicrobiota bacterium]